MDLQVWQATSNSILQGTEQKHDPERGKPTRELPGREKSFFFLFPKGI